MGDEGGRGGGEARAGIVESPPPYQQLCLGRGGPVLSFSALMPLSSTWLLSVTCKQTLQTLAFQNSQPVAGQLLTNNAVFPLAQGGPPCLNEIMSKEWVWLA